MYATHSAWILVADGVRARLFETRGAGTLSLVRAFRHPEEGRADVDRAKVLDEMARMLAAILAQGRLWGRYGYLVIVAPREVLEAIRARASDRVLDQVVATIEGDHTSLDARGIAELPEVRDLRPLFDLPAQTPIARATLRERSSYFVH